MSNLPIIVGKGLNKALFVFHDEKTGGYNVGIVWLKHPAKTGETFEIKDIKKIQAVVHFCDRESVQTTIDVLQMVLDKWMKEGEE